MSVEEWQIVWFTVWVSALSTILILPFGLGVAWLLARYDWQGKSVVETFITLPLVMPPWGIPASIRISLKYRHVVR